MALLVFSHPPAINAAEDQYREVYEYDALGRLVQTRHQDVDKQFIEYYRYDPAGNRIEKVVATDGSQGVLDPATFIITGDVTVAEGGTATVTIKRTGAWTTAHDVVVKTRAGTAISGTDYTALDTTVSFAANEVAKTVNVSIATDALSEINEVFSVHLESADSGAVVGVPNAALVTITGTGAATSTIRVLDATAMEGDLVQIRFVRDGSVSSSQDIKWQTVSGSATGGVDFTSVSPTTLTFGSSVNVATATLTTTADVDDEGDEFLWIYAAPDGATTDPSFSDPIARVRIIDDDDAPLTEIQPTSTVSFAFAGLSGGVSVSEGQTATFTIQRTGDTKSTHKVSVSVLPGTAQVSTGSSDFVPIYDQIIRFNPYETTKTISIETLADGVSEISETLTVLITSVDNGAFVGTANSRYVNINGTGSPSTTIGILGDAFGEEGDDINVTFTRTGSTSASQSMKFHTRIGTASYADFSPSEPDGDYSDIVTFGVGVSSVTKTISTEPDDDVEGDEYLWVYLEENGSSTPGITLGKASARVKIFDDDAMAEVSIANGSGMEGDKIPLVLTRSESGFFQYIYYYADHLDSGDTADIDEDFPETLEGYAVFMPDQTTTTIEIETKQDLEVEGSETFTVWIEEGASYTTLDNDSAVVTIEDDDS